VADNQESKDRDL